MLLKHALRLRPGQIVAFTGAGGKSGAIKRLAAEHSPLLITTTTRLGLEQSDLAGLHLVNPSFQETDDLPERLEMHGSVLITGEQHEDKWIAPSEGVLLATAEAVGRTEAPLLIEADGARGRSLKAPAEREPVIPPFVDLVVPIAGLDAIGQAIESEMVHRPQLVAALLEKEPDATLEAGDLASVLTSSSGGLKGVPEGAEVRALLTRATGAGLEDGRAAAEAILGAPRVRAVVLADLAEDDGVRELHGRTAGIVLAAGGSSRLGQPKQLVKFRGRPLVWHAVRAAREGGLDPIVVVVGQEAAGVRDALTGEVVTIIENLEWDSGQSGSVLAGLSAVEDSVEAAIFLLTDMPFVGPDLVRALIERHRRTLAPLVAPWAGGRRSNPVLFDRVTYSRIAALTGDSGGRTMFQEFDAEWIEWDDSITLDVDTPEDLERLRELE